MLSLLELLLDLLLDSPLDPHAAKTTDNTTSFSTSDNKNFIWDAYEAIRDTQISSEDFGFQYHCGIDFFNNHLLRSNTFKIVSFNVSAITFGFTP